jgi:hypothetical protein
MVASNKEAVMVGSAAAKFGRGILVAATFALPLPALQGSSAAAQTAASAPFQGLSGRWTGNGTVMLASGSKERLRCRAEYQVGAEGNALRQHLYCESQSYKFDLKSEIRHQGGSITGRWSEDTRNVGGNVSGTATTNGIVATVDGPGFSANVSVRTRGDRQAVQIVSKGEQLQDVSISLKRS